MIVKVVEAEHFDEDSRQKDFPFKAAVSGCHKDRQSSGANVGHKDTDSIQFAVRWSNANKPDLAHYTNAQPFGDKPRDVGADWDFDGKPVKAGGKGEFATKSTAVPPDATSMKLIIIYTDVMHNVPGDGVQVPLACIRLVSARPVAAVAGQGVIL